MTVHETDLGLALFADEFLQDPYPLYARMLATAPVHQIGDSGFYAVCGWDAVTDAVARPQDFSSNLTGTMVYQSDGTVGTFPMDDLGGPSQVLAIADDPAHALHRRKLVPQLAAKRIRTLESFVAAATERLWAEQVSDGHVEWMSAIANRLPMLVVCRLLGVPDEDAEQLAEWGYASTQLLEGLVSQEQLAGAGTAAMQLAQYVAEKFDAQAAHPQDTLMGALARDCAEGELDVMTAQMMMITLFGAGGESTASLIGSATALLATRPELQHRLRDDYSLIPVFLEETLRFEPPFRGHYRHVLRDCVLAGHELAEGSRLILLWGAANRDPAHFASPDEFRLDRPNSKGHIAFGKGIHFCVGAALARMEARIVLEHVLANTRRLEADGPSRWLPSLLVRRLERLTLRVD
ncbi:cytochrome P450 [Mycolicibacterium sp. S3B2]|uniref:cytochrome P450 n=1 Tax=Mycolicibacterium sp. S3B2 TaxID=3415120 RepID=UPI003C7D183C